MNPISTIMAIADYTAPRILARRVTPRTLVRPPYPRVFGQALRAASRVQVGRWDRALRHVREVQEAILLEILRHARRTQFGRARDFDGIGDYEDFVFRVPVGDYDAFSPYINRMRAGEGNVLVPEVVRYFGNSSGSSNHGKSKFLPITERQIRHQQRAGTDAVMRYLRRSGDGGLFSGFTLGLFPPTTMKQDGASLVTSNPALMATKMPAIARPVYLPHEDVRTMANYDEKLAVIADRYLDHDVRAVTGTTCWFTLLFEKVLAAARARGRDARSVAEIWPNLSVLFGGGVAAAPYLPVIRRLVGRDDLTLVDTYNATEGGVYAASDLSGAPGMLVLPHRGVFFEFVPLDQRTPDAVQASRVPLWAVEPDRAYSIVVTTTSGLYAYELGDIVRFPSVEPLRIEFVGRLGGCLSVTQELTTHVEIERAVAHASASCGCTTLDFGAAADVGVDGTAKSRYALFVEFQQGRQPASISAFAHAFDAGLCEQNRVYREHRSGEVALLAAVVYRSPPAGHAASSKRSPAETCRASFPASSTTRRRSCSGRTRPRRRVLPAAQRIRSRHESDWSGDRRHQRSRRVDARRGSRAHEARPRAPHRHGHGAHRRAHRRVDHRAARFRSAREPRLRRLGPPVRERVRGGAPPPACFRPTCWRTCGPSSSGSAPGRRFSRANTSRSSRARTSFAQGRIANRSRSSSATSRPSGGRTGSTAS